MLKTYIFNIDRTGINAYMTLKLNLCLIIDIPSIFNRVNVLVWAVSNYIKFTSGQNRTQLVLCSLCM